MKPTVRRDRRIPPLLTGATLVFGVYDPDKRIGTVAQFGGDGTRFPRSFRVVEAGSGVAIPDPHATYQSAQEAAEAICHIRQASAALDVDAATGLTGFERDVLDFEAQFHFRHRGSKDDAVRILFPNVSGIRYAQIVNALIDRPEALAYSPTTVNRLRRLRDTRRAARPAVTR